MSNFTSAPGSNGAPRCAGFSGRPDAGVSVTGDAGAAQGEAGTEDVALDAAEPAAEPAAEELSEDDAEFSEDVKPRARHKSGCDCQLSSAPRARHSGFLALLAFALALLVRRVSASALRARSRQ